MLSDKMSEPQSADSALEAFCAAALGGEADDLNSDEAGTLVREPQSADSALEAFCAAALGKRQREDDDTNSDEAGTLVREPQSADSALEAFCAAALGKRQREDDDTNSDEAGTLVRDALVCAAQPPPALRPQLQMASAHRSWDGESCLFLDAACGQLDEVNLTFVYCMQHALALFRVPVFVRASADTWTTDTAPTIAG